jgi:PhzF family phenazine biosynthesis protein
MVVQVQIVNAFTDNGLGGNPAGVVVDANELSSQQKLSVASKTGLSETAFVSSSSSAAIKLEFLPQIGKSRTAVMRPLQLLAICDR